MHTCPVVCRAPYQLSVLPYSPRARAKLQRHAVDSSTLRVLLHRLRSPNIYLRPRASFTLHARAQDLLGGPGFRVALCVLSAIAFGAGLYRGASEDVGTEFFAAYVLEMCMSAENLFAIFLVFRYFKVPAPHQEHVLWWGLGVSAVLRGIVIISGGLFIAAQREAILIFAVGGGREVQRLTLVL